MRTSAPILALALGLIVASPPSAWPQASAQAGPIAWANLEVERDQPTKLRITGRASNPAIAEALERISGQPPETEESGVGWVQWTTELPAPSRHGLVLREEVPLEPLLEVLRARGQPSLILTVNHPPVAFIELPGMTKAWAQRALLSASIPTTPLRGPLVLELGWRDADIVRAILLLVLAFLTPLVAGLWVWRRSIARDRGPEAWFGRAQAIHMISMAGWVVWMVAIEATQITGLTRFASAGRGSSWMSGPLCIIAFLPVPIALLAMLKRIIRRLRGFDALPRGSARFMGSLRLLGALALVAAALSAFAAEDYRAAVFAMIGAIATAVLLPGPRGPLGLAPQALSSGALRDRLFDLARRAGVKLRELYVVPMRQRRMANAFAVNGGVVMVADELLDRMSRREVDAVLAHEITHLEHHHPLKALLAAVGVWGLLTSTTSALGIPYGTPATFVVSWLTYLLVVRRFEFAADAGAAALTSDAEAMISGLGHLARLNDTPLAWHGAWRWLITHPTTEARVHVIGRRAGLTPERVAELVAHGLPSDERYGRAARPGEEQRVFSTAWKTATSGRLSLGMLAIAVLVPAAALALARSLRVLPPHVVAAVVGGALAWLAILLIHDRFSARIVSGLESALRRRMKDAASDETSGPASEEPSGATPGVLFVTLAPGDRARIYEGFLDWDLGLLAIAPDRLRYRGEQITLDLPRHAIRAIEVGAIAPSWIPAPRVIVRWLGPKGEEAVAVRDARCRSVSAMGRASRALAARLEAWRQSSGAGGPSEAVAAPPGIGPVTARTPREAASPRDLSLLIVLLGTFSAGASFVLGFDLWLGLDVFAAAFIGIMAMRWPMVTARERSPKVVAPESERRAA